MNERRRSMRVPASLPVWLKDAQGGERTQTTDVSAHGVSVRTDRSRPIRQYVELELTLPGDERIALTAMVARNYDHGAGLDFFTLDVGVSRRWLGFLMALRRSVAGGPVRGVWSEPVARSDALDSDTVASNDAEGAPSGPKQPEEAGPQESPPPVREDPTNAPTEAKGSDSSEVGPDPVEARAKPAEELTQSAHAEAEPNEIAIAPAAPTEPQAPPPPAPKADPSMALKAREISPQASQEDPPGELQVPERSAASPVAPGPSEGLSDDAEAPSFLVKPRDLGRLWTFYRGELAQGSLRLESPLPQATGKTVEVLVVHPRSQEEWSFTGQVVRCQPGHAGLPYIDVVLLGVDTGVRAAFRSFLATGRAPSVVPRPWDPSPLEAEERLPSVIVDIDDLDGLSSPQAPDFESEETTVVTEPPSPIRRSDVPTQRPSGADELLPYGVDLEVSTSSDALRSDPEGAEDTHKRFDDRDTVQGRPGTANEDLIEARETAAEDAYGDSDVIVIEEAVLERLNSEPSTSGAAASPQGLFASFFQEAAESREKPVGISRGRPPGPQSVVVTAAPVEGVVRGQAKADLRPVEAPPATPGTFFELDEPSSVPNSGLGETAHSEAQGDGEVENLPPSTLPESGPANFSPPARRRAADERGAADAHQPMSTAGTNPGLDREIGLARARVVRCPDDAEASVALADLLYERGRAETLEEAIRAYERVLALSPTHRSVHARLGELHARAGRYSRANEHLRHAEKNGHHVDPDLREVVRRGLRHA